MTKFVDELYATYGLKVPKEPSNEWLKAKLLKRYYTCRWCGKETHIHDVRHVEVLGKKFICKKCARILEPVDEDVCPIMLN